MWLIPEAPVTTWDRDDRAPRPVRRSIVAVGALAVGFVAARNLPGVAAPIWLSLACAALAMSAASRAWPCVLSLTAAAALFGAGWFALRTREAPHDSLVHFLHSDSEPHLLARPQLVRVEGIVEESPREGTPFAGALAKFSRLPRSLRFTLAVGSLVNATGSSPVSERVVVFVDASNSGARPIPAAGDHVRITGFLAPILPAMNPGEPDRLLRAAQDGIVGRLSVRSAALVETLQPPDSFASRLQARWFRLLESLRAHARAALDRLAGPATTSEPDAGRALLAAMLLGLREPGLHEADEALRRLGLVHLVAISGFNIALVGALAAFLARLTGDRPRLERTAVAAAIILYLLIVPAESPILRAGLMVLAFIVSEAAGRRYDRLTILGWIAFALLLWHPLDLWSLGFQLSFGIVAAFLFMARRSEERLFGLSLRGTIPWGQSTRPAMAPVWSGAARISRTLITTSLLAWLVATPLVMHHTGLVSPLGPILTLVALPISAGALWVGYTMLLVAAVAPGAAEWTSGVLGLVADRLVAIAVALDDLPGMSLRVPRVSAWWAGAAVLLVLYWFARGHTRDRVAWAGAAIIVAWFGAEVWLSSRLPSSVPLRIDTLAVGDGTCHIIRSASDAMLWDCGGSRPSAGLRDIPDAARALGVWRVPLAVVTHDNYDHFSTLLDAADRLGIREVIVGKAFIAEAGDTPDGAAAALLDGLRLRNITVRPVVAGDSLTLGPARVEFLSPPRGASFASVNDTSLVARFSVGTTSGPRHAVFTGDIQDDPIRALAPAGLRADILEVPHHGSARPVAIEFLAALDPEVVLQSTGPGRAGDDRWQPLRASRTWLTTATDGALFAELRADGSLRAGSFRGGRAR